MQITENDLWNCDTDVIQYHKWFYANGDWRKGAQRNMYSIKTCFPQLVIFKNIFICNLTFTAVKFVPAGAQYICCFTNAALFVVFFSQSHTKTFTNGFCVTRQDRFYSVKHQKRQETKCKYTYCLPILMHSFSAPLLFSLKRNTKNLAKRKNIHVVFAFHQSIVL